MTNSIQKAILYYDGKCSLCSREISLLNTFKNSQLELVDLWQVDIDIPRYELQRILHLRTAQGDWLTGLDATASAWQHTKFGFILAPLRWPLIKQIADNVYIRWTKQRFKHTS